MTNIYLIKFLETGLEYMYTSLDALYTAHKKESVGVTKEHLYNVFGKKSFYSNKKVTINKITAYSRGDVDDKLDEPVVIYR